MRKTAKLFWKIVVFGLIPGVVTPIIVRSTLRAQQTQQFLDPAIYRPDVSFRTFELSNPLSGPFQLVGKGRIEGALDVVAWQGARMPVLLDAGGNPVLNADGKPTPLGPTERQFFAKIEVFAPEDANLQRPFFTDQTEVVNATTGLYRRRVPFSITGVPASPKPYLVKISIQSTLPRFKQVKGTNERKPHYELRMKKIRAQVN